MEVYLDLVMGLNFLVDFLLLLGTNRISGFPLGAGRCAAAAGLGGLYSGACLLPGFSFLGGLLWRCVSLGLMGALAFGWDKSAWKRCGVFLILSLALGGAALQLDRGDFGALLLAGGMLYGLCALAFGNGIGQQEYVPITLTFAGRTQRVLALRDSGNTLRDPISGEPVLILSAQVAQDLMGLTREDLLHPLETLARRPLPGLRLIPYRAVGQGGSLLLGLRLDEVKIGSRRASTIVAFAPEGFGKGQVFQALTGGAV